MNRLLITGSNVGESNTIRFRRVKLFLLQVFLTWSCSVHSYSFFQLSIWRFKHTPYCYWILQLPWPLATDFEQLHFDTGAQHHQHRNSFFHFAICHVFVGIEETPFSSVTKTHIQCFEHDTISYDNMNLVSWNSLVMA